MHEKFDMTLFLTSVLILSVTSLILLSNNSVSSFFSSDAYAQTPPDLGGFPSDNSTDLGGGLGGLPSDNSTSGATTPEFGPVASIILVLAIVSVIMISARTRLKFSRF